MDGARFRSSALGIVAIAALSLSASTASASEAQDAENASNPLAKSRNTDLRYKHFDLVDGSFRHNAAVEGSFMAADTLKVTYEFHYWATNLAGSTEQGPEKLSFKGIHFPKEGALGSWKYRLAVGVEWIADFDNADKGIGSGSDQLAPLVGVALVPRPGTVIIPLVQQFFSISGPKINTTGPRLIALQTLPKDFWLRIDGRIPIEWENERAVPASLELQLGKHFADSFSMYAEGLFGIGGDRPYDVGAGVGLRFKY